MRRALAPFLLVTLLALRAFASDIIDEGWFVVHLRGQPLGYGHEVVKRTKHEGEPALLWLSEQRFQITNDGQATVTEEKSETLTTEDGLLLRACREEQEADRRTSITVERSAEGVRVVHTIGETTRTKLVPVPPGVDLYKSLDGLLLRTRGLEPGRTHTFTTWSTDSTQVVTETARIEGRRRVRSLGEEVDAFVVRTTNSSMPGVEAEVLLDGEGRLLSMSAVGIEVTRVTRAEALAASSARFDLSSRVELDGAVPAWGTLDAATVEAIVDGAQGSGAFPSNEYQEVEEKDGKILLRLRARRLPASLEDARIGAAPVPEEVRPCLDPTALMESDHPEIRAAAEQALGSERRALAAARLLSRAVHARLRKESPAVGTATALETLRAATGDCTEHAALFCALARAAGLPARQASGIALRADGAGYHAWAEVWIAGTWVPVDPTIDAVGLPAVSICLERSRGAPEDAPALSVLRIMGATRLALRSAARRGESFDPRAVPAPQGDAFRDPMLDVAFDLSGGWRVFRRTLPHVSFIGPERVAVNVTVAEGVFGPNEWQEFEEVLRRTANVRTLRLVAQTTHGGRPARVYEFTSGGEGVQALAGRIRVVVAPPHFYAITAIYASGTEPTPQALDAIIDRVEIAGAKNAPPPAEPAPADEWGEPAAPK